VVGNVPFGVYQQIARQTDNPLVRPTSRSRRQVRERRRRDVYADDRKVTVRKFPNIRASITRGSFCTVGVRVFSDPAEEFNRHIHAQPQSSKGGINARTKYSVYAVVRICGFQFPYAVVKIPKHRKVLGENIRTHRRNLKWSQEKLAEKSDLHHNYIGDIERGEENVSVDALMRIATALKVSLSNLVNGI
jgi:DNA-binding XRE family transcriptional regulator